MKRILLSLVLFSSLMTFAQDEEVQPGTPAVLEAPNGKKIKTFLQRLEGGNLTFQALKSPNDITVPADKIKSLEFFPKYDAVALREAYNSGDYDKTLSILEPAMSDYAQYMPIANNMREAFVMMFDSYLRNNNFSMVRKYIDLMKACNDPALTEKARVAEVLAAINEQDFEKAKTIRSEVESPAASLYLDAEIKRAQGQPKEAVQTVAVIIAEHGNDMDWLPSSELLAAYCYLDMTGTNSVISTNSAMYTARQVKNMYHGSPIAADAEKLWVSLGGDEVEAQRLAEKAEREAARQKEKEEREAQRKATREAAAARKKAEAEARKAMVSSTNTTTNTESE